MPGIKLSQLRPTETEIDMIRVAARKNFAEACSFGDLEEALGNDLHESSQGKLLELVKKMTAGNGDIHDAFGIAAIMTTAFSNHVNKYAELDVTRYIDHYADSKAEELREQGRMVEAWA